MDFKLTQTLEDIYLFSMILIIDFLAGWLLDLTIGNSAWKYAEGIHILGYALLDYIFFSMFFCFITEKVYLFINGLPLNF